MDSNDSMNIKLEKSGIFGYRVEDVENYISNIKEYCYNLESENRQLESKIKILASKIKEYRDDEENIREALLGAQKLANNVVNDAREKADKIINDATSRATTKARTAQFNADRILKETKIDIEREQKKLLKLQKEVSTFKAKLLSLYKSHLDLISSLPEVDNEESSEKKLDDKSKNNNESVISESKDKNDVVDFSLKNQKSDSHNFNNDTSKLNN